MSISQPYTLIINGALDGHYVDKQAAWNRLAFRKGWLTRGANRAFYAKIIYEPKIGPQQTIYEGNGED